MSNRVWIDERIYKIRHVCYLENGTTEYFWIYYKENYTKDTIYIPEELFDKHTADTMWPTGEFEHNGVVKKVVYEAKDGTIIPIGR